MNGERHRRRAAVLLILAWALRLHPWVPLLLVGGFVSWIILHKRLEGDRGEALARGWRRAWPPGTLVLIPLLVASTLAFWMSDVPLVAKVLPVTLSLLGLSMILLGSVWTVVVQLERFRMARKKPSLAGNREPRSPGKGSRASAA